MNTIIRMLLVLFFVCSSFATHSIQGAMQITTKPAPVAGMDQKDFAPHAYDHKQLVIDGAGYYSMEGDVCIDTLLENPALYIGSTTYPIDVYVGGKRVYRWGTGKESNHFADYRSHSITLDPTMRGKQKLRVDFWCTGERFALPAFYFGEMKDVSSRATLVSFFNIHLLNGILVAAVFISILFGGMYVISGMKQKEVLYFSLFSLTLVFALLIFPLNSQQFNEIVLFKIARVGTLFLPLWMLLFVRSYTVILDRSRLLFWIPLGLTLWSSLNVILADQGKVGINDAFNGVGMLVTNIEFLLVLVILIRSVFITKKAEVALIFTGFLAFIALVIHDFYYLSINMLPLFWWVSYGYLLITLAMLGALMMRQRKAYDDLLFYRIELLEANRKIALESESRESFIQTIAHELRTPLHGMDTGLRALKDRMGTESLDQLISTGVFASFHRLNMTLQNIFGYVAAENGKLRILSHRFNLFEMIDELHTHFVTRAGEKGIAFTVLYSTPSMPEFYRGDRDHIQLAMANIMFNAVKYTEVGGVTCNISYHNEKLTCSVSDTGCGLKEEMRDAFFNAFHRTEEFSFSQRYEGVGLGLSITDAVVKAMGGEINIESIVDRGTSVMLSIPLVADYDEPSTRLEHFTILVVDDNQVNCKLLAMMVNKMGCATELAFNGEEAVRLQKKHRYDLILMDIQMPIMDGFAATKMIRKFDEATPIIAVTANADFTECINSGMNEYLSKPVNYEHLNELLLRFLN